MEEDELELIGIAISVMAVPGSSPGTAMTAVDLHAVGALTINNTLIFKDLSA
jgi:hypothetical protein